jgi:hypothetical protein
LLYNPAYSYLGPSGYDRVFYYAHARSLLIDHDLDFRDEMAIRPPSGEYPTRGGRPLNKYPFGSALLALPALAVMHLGVLAADRLGLAHVPADGYSMPYVLAYALGQMTWAILGLWLLYRALLRYFSPRTAAIAVIAGWSGTNALLYLAIDLMMAHAAAIFSIAWCSYEAVRIRESPSDWRVWLRLGASAALVVMVRYQNGIYLLVPLAAVSVCGDLSRGSPGRALINVAIAAVGFLALFSIQFLVWKATFGAWVLNTYAAEFQFEWFRPRIREVANLLAIYLPAYALGLGGCLALAARRRDPIVAAAGLSWLLNIYITSCWWAYSIVDRTASDMMFPICLGLGSIISLAERRWPKGSTILILLWVLWYLPLGMIGVDPRRSLLDSWVTNARMIVKW